MSGLILLGAGTFALVVADLADDLGHTAVACAINIGHWGPGQRHGGLPVYDTRQVSLWPDEGLPRVPFVSATIWPERKGLIRDMESLGYKPLSLVHPDRNVSRKAAIGNGCVICRGAVIESYAEIGAHVIVNRGALVGHNVVIWPYSTIGPGAVLCGGVTVGQGALIGAGATIKEGVSIGTDAVVGMGAVVVKSVEVGATVKGNPAR